MSSPERAVDESTLFLTGQAEYLDDVADPLLDGAGHVVFVRSLVAHATFTVDLSAARLAPGVILAITSAENTISPLGAYNPTLSPRFAQPLLAEKKVRYVGEPIAAVVAETRAQAIDAAELVLVDYDELPAVMTVADSIGDTTLLFDDDTLSRLSALAPSTDRGPATNVVLTADGRGGRSDHDPARFASADVVVKRTFRNPRQLAAPIECRGAAAAWSDTGDLHLWASTQTPHALRNRIAPMYDLDPDRIHVVAGPFVGGGFGGKGAPGPEEQLVAHLSRLAGRPVKWIESRSENLTAAPQGRSEDVEITLAGSNDGAFHALSVVLHKDAGAYPSSGAALPLQWSRPIITSTYEIAHAEFDTVTAVTNAPPVSALRGAGRAPVIAALERAIDLFAGAINMDPAEVRRRNLIRPGSSPYTTALGTEYDEADYVDGFDRLLALADYDGLRFEQLRRRDLGEQRQIGIGLANYIHRTNGGSTEQVLVTIDNDGGATVVTGTTSQGHGHARTWAKIASAELGIPCSRITVIEGITDAIATGVGAIGSRSAQTAGVGVHRASQQLVEMAKAAAAERFEAAPADIVFERNRGTFHVAGSPSVSIDWGELALSGLEQNRELSCDYVYDPLGRDVYPSGSHLAVVEVDTATGGWRVIRFAAVDDAGVRIDDDIVEGQLRGGIALGIAQVLGEEVIFGPGGIPLTGTFLDYQIVSVDQLCQIDLEAQIVPSSVNEHGYKAVGESGPIGAMPATHNAVIDAIRHLGIDHIEIPCTPQKVWRALDSAG